MSTVSGDVQAGRSRFGELARLEMRLRSGGERPGLPMTTYARPTGHRADQTMTEERHYDVFISYASTDQKIVRHLRRRLVWAPWSLRSRQRMSVFHDSASLAAGSLDDNLRQALTASRHLLVVASPEASVSTWVEQEVVFWLSQRRPDQKLLVACTDAVSWSAGQPPSLEILPPVMRSLPAQNALGAVAGTVSGTPEFPSGQPTDWARQQLVADLRWARTTRRLRTDRRWRTPVLTIASAITDEPVELLSRENQRRKTAILSLAALLTVAALAGVGVAWAALTGQAAEARGRESVQLAAAAGDDLLIEPDESADEALRAFAVAASTTTRSALLQQFLGRPGLLRYLPAEPRTALSINDQAFSPDGSSIATIGRDGRLAVLNLTTNQAVGRWDLPEGNGVAVRWSPDGRQVLGVTQGGLTRIDPHERTPGATILVDSVPVGFTVLPNGEARWYSRASGFWSLAAGSSSPRLLRASAGNFQGAVIDVDQAFVRGADGRTLRVPWNGAVTVVDGTRSDGPPGYDYAIARSPDGKFVAYQPLMGTIALRSLTGAERKSFTGQSESELRTLAFSPDGRYLWASYPTFTRVISLADGKYRDITEPYRRGEEVAFSPDGTLVASTNADHSATSISDLAALIEGISGTAVYSLDFEASGTHAVLARSSGSESMIDMVSTPTTDYGPIGPEHLAVAGSRESLIRSAVSPDGSTVVAGSLGTSDRLRIWRRTPLGSWREEEYIPLLAQPHALALSPDGTHLAAGTDSGCTYIWDLADHEDQTPFCEDDARIATSVYFSSDGSRLGVESLSQDTSDTHTRISVWDVRNGNAPPVLTRDVDSAGGFDGLRTVQALDGGAVLAIDLSHLTVKTIENWDPTGRFEAADGEQGLSLTADAEGQLSVWKNHSLWMTVDTGSGYLLKADLGAANTLAATDSYGYLQVASVDPARLRDLLCSRLPTTASCAQD